MRVQVDARVAAQARRRVAIDPKLEYHLGMLARQGETGTARVVVESAGRPDLAALRAAGARVQAAAGNVVRATVPIAALHRLTAIKGVRFVRPPTREHLDAIAGEEVNASNAAASIQKGWSGKGVSVAIIDGGFKGYEDRIAEGELPANLKTRNFCDDGFTEITEHGTAVAEIVHEMAPLAQIYLICVEFSEDMILAERYARSVGAKIISHSASSFDGRGDGAPTPGSAGAAIAEARQSGVLWVNSAGNYAQNHWMGTFVDANANGFMDFAPGSEGNGILLDEKEPLCAILRWDQWPVATDDYDLLLLNQAGAIVAGSQTRQTGTQPPTEILTDPSNPDFCFQNKGPKALFYLAIFAFKATTTPRLDLFAIAGAPLQYPVPAGSLGDPGASPFSFTVGAVCWQNGALEPYSSQGPTIDGRLKPDIAGQDANSGKTYGPFSGCGTGPSGNTGFLGTSASTPAVAGAAALVKEENPGFTADQIQAFLQQNAQDIGPAGPDNESGSGRLFVPTPAAIGPTKKDTIAPLAKAVASKGVKGKSIKLLSQASDETGEVRLNDTVKKGARTITTLRTGFAATKRGTTYYILWTKPPATLVGALTHCVQSFDRTGNKSKVSCAPLTIAKK
jgi:subtilisin family serine protease